MVVLKLKDGKEPKSFASYENNELVTYAEAEKSIDPKPYIAAVFTSSGVDRNVFILGDGRKTINPTARRHGFAATDYYNGPLEPETSYSISERIILNDKVVYFFLFKQNEFENFNQAFKLEGLRFLTDARTKNGRQHNSLRKVDDVISVSITTQTNIVSDTFSYII